LILSGYALYTLGPVDLYMSAFSGLDLMTYFTDLVISLSLISVWMIQDSRALGRSVIPYLVLTVFLGSVGPLLYLIQRARPPQPLSRSTAATPPTPA